MSGRKRAAAPPPKPAIDDVEDLLTVVRDGVDSIWLWRRAPDGWAFVERRDPATFRELGITETTRQRSGGGEYKARIRRRNGAQWGEQRMFTIEGEPKALRTEGPTAEPAVPAPKQSELPSWVEKYMIPLGVTLATGVVNRLMAEPKTDPLLLELIRRGGNKGDSVDPLELQRLVLDAEARGETRGRELGELSTRGERAVNAAAGPGVVETIREVAPIFHSLLNRGAPSPSPSSEMPAARAVPATTTDIVPVWLRPFMSFKPFVISAADAGHDPRPMADMVIANSTDDMWAAISEAENAGRLESDFYAALPDMRATPPRQAFATTLIAEIRAALQPEKPAAAPAPKRNKKAQAAGDGGA